MKSRLVVQEIPCQARDENAGRIFRMEITEDDYVQAVISRPVAEIFF